MPDEPTALGAPRQVPAPPVELAAEACASVIYYLRQRTLTSQQRELIASDYARRRADLDESGRAAFDGQLAASFLKGDKALPHIGAVSVDGAREAVDVAIVVIKNVELQAACAIFDIDIDDFIPIGTRRYYRFSMPAKYNRLPKSKGGATKDLSVVLTMSGRALDVHATQVVNELLVRFDPKALFLVGMAAGNPDKVRQADVVIPRLIQYYDSERLTPDGPLPRPDYLPVPEEVITNVTAYDVMSPDFYERLNQFVRTRLGRNRPPGFNARRRFHPTVHADGVVLASGSKLVADGRLLPSLRQQFSEQLIAADQESYGFGTACRTRWWGVFRGISDFGDGGKNSDWQFLATAVAAMALRYFLENQYIPPGAREL